METYSALRQFADSWWLLVMFVGFEWLHDLIYGKRR